MSYANAARNGTQNAAHQENFSDPSGNQVLICMELAIVCAVRSANLATDHRGSRAMQIIQCLAQWNANGLCSQGPISGRFIKTEYIVSFRNALKCGYVLHIACLPNGCRSNKTQKTC